MWQFIRCLFLTATIVPLSPLHAGLLVFTDKAAFLAATSSTATIDFSGIAPPGGFTDFSNVSGGLTIDSVNFQGPETMCTGGGNSCFPGSELFVADEQDPGWTFGVPAVLVGPTNLPAGSDLDFSSENAQIDVTPPADTEAFGLDVGIGGGIAASYLGITVDGVTTNVVPSLQPSSGFIGFISDQPLSDIQVSPFLTFGNPVILDVITAAAAVPEPGTFILAVLSLGLIYCAGLLRFDRDGQFENKDLTRVKRTHPGRRRH